MGSKTFLGVRFEAFSHDHPPPHVHGFYGSAEVILELDFKTRDIRLARRRKNVKPANAKRSDVQRVRRAAERFGEELFKLWEVARG